MKKLNLIGKKFNKLTVIEICPDRQNGKVLWLCKCECGNIVKMSGSNLKGSEKRKGNTSCSKCYRNFSLTGGPAKTHGMKKTRFYRIWNAIKQRTGNPNYIYASNYSERGIKICKKWKESFEKFRDDMYESYLKHVKDFGEKNTSIERIDNNGDYCLENCKWATRAEQRRNTRDSHYLTFDGETKILDDWAKKLKFNSGSVIGKRLQRGWTVEDALRVPIQLNGKKYKHDIIRKINN